MASDASNEPDAARERLQTRFDAAVEILEEGQYPESMNLLLGLISDAKAGDFHRLEALSRALLTQTLMQTGQEDEAIAQADAAFAAAEQSNHRDTIHRCMALQYSVKVLTQG